MDANSMNIDIINCLQNLLCAIKHLHEYKIMNLMGATVTYTYKLIIKHYFLIRIHFMYV